MRYHTDSERVCSMLRAVAETCALIVQQVNDLAEYFSSQGGDGGGLGALDNLIATGPVDARALFSQIIVDSGAKTITFQGRTCRLGNTLVFRLMERLARRPNQFVTFDRLIRDVWDGHARSDDAIRSVMKELRRRLRRSGLRQLASSLHGQKRAYALHLKV